MAKKVRIQIECVEKHEVYKVNQKEVYKDTDGKYIAREQLTSKEYRGFTRYHNMVIINPRFRVHTPAEYFI